MTVPFGSGAFMKTEARAEELALSMIDVAAGVDVAMTALVSDLTQILGDAVGNVLQLHEIVRFLTGDYREPRLAETVLALAGEILVMGDLAATPDAARAEAQRRLDDGSAAECFGRMVAAFGGPADFVERPDRHLEQAPVRAPVFPATDGIIQDMDCYAIGMALGLGAGRTLPDDPVDNAVGLSGWIGRGVGASMPICLLLRARRRLGGRIHRDPEPCASALRPPPMPVIRSGCRPDAAFPRALRPAPAAPFSERWAAGGGAGPERRVI